jgi:hypothetical protein
MFDDFDGPAGSPPNPALWTRKQGENNKDVLFLDRIAVGSLGASGHRAYQVLLP